MMDKSFEAENPLALSLKGKGVSPLFI